MPSTPGIAGRSGQAEAGDVILKFNGVPVENDSHLINMVSLTEVGKRGAAGRVPRSEADHADDQAGTGAGQASGGEAVALQTTARLAQKLRIRGLTPRRCKRRDDRDLRRRASALPRRAYAAARCNPSRRRHPTRWPRPDLAATGVPGGDRRPSPPWSIRRSSFDVGGGHLGFEQFGMERGDQSHACRAGGCLPGHTPADRLRNAKGSTLAQQAAGPTSSSGNWLSRS